MVGVCVCRREREECGEGGRVRASLPAVGTAQPGQAVACCSRAASCSLFTGSRAPKEAGRRQEEWVLQLSPYLSCVVSGAPASLLFDGGLFPSEVRMFFWPRHSSFGLGMTWSSLRLGKIGDRALAFQALGYRTLCVQTPYHRYPSVIWGNRVIRSTEAP